MPQHLNTRDAAHHLGVSYGHLRNMRAKGRGPAPSHRDGGQCFFAVETLDQWQRTRARLVRSVEMAVTTAAADAVNRWVAENT